MSKANLSRRYLKCFASGIANMFASSANHYAWLAHHYGITDVRIDLLTMEIQPTEFDINRNRTLVEMCHNSLMRNIERLKPPSSLVSAKLTATFGIHDYKLTDDRNGIVGRSLFKIVLTDDRGKEWAVTHIIECILAQGDGFGDPNR